MADPFLSEIRICSFNYAPSGWAMCNGQLMPINQNQALFSLLGTNFGGDGRVTFGLPDLRGRVPLHWGSDFTLGQRGGEISHTLSQSELPAHNHTLQGSSLAGDTAVAAQHLLAATGELAYRNPRDLVALHSASVSNSGGSIAHQNMQPYLVLTFIIAIIGIFPSQT
jgi:microcystin-dependent protein